MTLRRPLQQLIERWLVHSKQAELNSFSRNISTLDRHRFVGVFQAYKQCADELSALLASVPEVPEQEAERSALSDAPTAPSGQVATWMASVSAGGEHEVFYVPRAGWASHLLGYHEGIGPYFSLPEALRRVEQQIGELPWRPHRLDQKVTVANVPSAQDSLSEFIRSLRRDADAETDEEKNYERVAAGGNTKGPEQESAKRSAAHHRTLALVYRNIAAKLQDISGSALPPPPQEQT